MKNKLKFLFFMYEFSNKMLFVKVIEDFLLNWFQKT